MAKIPESPDPELTPHPGTSRSAPMDNGDSASSSYSSSTDKLKVYFSGPQNCQFYFGVEPNQKGRALSSSSFPFVRHSEAKTNVVVEDAHLKSNLASSNNNGEGQTRSNSKTAINIESDSAYPPTTSQLFTEVDVLRTKCAALTRRVGYLERTNDLILTRMIALETRLEAIDSEKRQQDEQLKQPQDDPLRCRDDLSRGRKRMCLRPETLNDSGSSHCNFNGISSGYVSDTMETSSDVSNMTREDGRSSLCGEDMQDRPGIRTATPSPAPSFTQDKPYTIVATQWASQKGVTAPQIAETCPGHISCIFELVNWGQIPPFTDPHAVTIAGKLGDLPKQVGIAKTFGVFPTDDGESKVAAAITYKYGSIRIAFEAIVDGKNPQNNTFSVGFLQGQESANSEALTELLVNKKGWISLKSGRPQDNKVSTTLGSVRIIACINASKKALMEISIATLQPAGRKPE